MLQIIEKSKFSTSTTPGSVICGQTTDQNHNMKSASKAQYFEARNIEGALKFICVGSTSATPRAFPTQIEN